MLNENEISYDEPFSYVWCAFGLEEVKEKINNNLFVYTVPVPGSKSAILPVWRIRDAFPGFRILLFTHPGSKNSNKREWWKKICCLNFLCSHKFHKIAN